MSEPSDSVLPKKKSKGLPPHLTPGNPGNSGGKRKRSGRRPNAWKEFAGQSLKDPEVQAKVLARAKAGDPSILKILVDSAQGAPDQKLTIAQSDADALDVLFNRLRPKTDPSN